MHKNVTVLALIKNTSVNTIQPEPGRENQVKLLVNRRVTSIYKQLSKFSVHPKRGVYACTDVEL